MTVRRLRVGVLGLGIGRTHPLAYKALPELYEIAAVCDLDAAKLAATGAEFGAGRTTTRIADAGAGHSAETDSVVTLPIASDHPRYASWVPAARGFARKAFDG